MARGKTSTLTCRIDPDLKEALRTAAEREHRSIANMVEVLIRDWCSHSGIAVPKQAAGKPKNAVIKPSNKGERK